MTKALLLVAVLEGQEDGKWKFSF